LLQIYNKKISLFSIIFFTSGSAQKGSITLISDSTTKNPGEDITFDCTVVKPKEISVSWLKGSQMLTLGSSNVFSNPRITVSVNDDSNTYSLHVSF
jgi:hypothetical protein